MTGSGWQIQNEAHGGGWLSFIVNYFAVSLKYFKSPLK